MFSFDSANVLIIPG